MKQILLANAHEAWKTAIYYHDKIQDGFVSLQYQKSFISSLHNAVELFLKQIMLNNTDYSIASIKKINNIQDAQLQLDFFQSNDLNAFFYGLKKNQIKKFYSTEFNKLIEIAHKLLNMERSLKTELQILQNLRNDETHFYINENTYLSEDNFCILHNFMVDFYEAIVNKELFFHVMTDFIDSKYILNDQEKIMEFNRNKEIKLSYIDYIKNNPLVQKIKKSLIGDSSNKYGYYGYYEEYYELAICLINDIPEFQDKIDDIFTFLQLMGKYKLFEIICEETEFPPELNLSETSMEYIIKINF